MARLREMLQRGRHTLDENEIKAKSMKGEVERLTRLAGALGKELRKWGGMNVELRQKLAWVAQSTFSGKGTQ